MSPPSPLATRLDELLWGERLDRMPAWRAALVRFGRLLYALGRDLTQGYLSLQAMSLVYTTLLSLVPLLAVSFSVLAHFGVHNQLEPLLLQALEPLGEKGTEVTRAILGFVDNMKVGVLGSLGLAFLIFTVVSLIQKVEQVFNYTWHTEVGRPFSQRFSQYLSVLLIGPVLFFSAVGLSASLRSSAFVSAVLEIEPFGTLIGALSRLAPYLLLTLAFAFVYVFVPNVRVRVRSALVGALVATLLWQGVGWIFSRFIATSTQYTAIYSGLAIVILLMIWVYIAWLIVLVGASVAFYHQNPEYLASRSRDLHLSNRLRERLSLLVAGQVTRRYLRGEEPWSAEGLASALGVPGVSTQRVLSVLEKEHFVVRTGDDPPRYLPARAPEGIPLTELLEGVRCFEERFSGCRGTAPDPGIAAIETWVDQAVADALGGMTLKDLAQSLHDPGPVVREMPPDAAPDAPGEARSTDLRDVPDPI
jgi:membrane protein